MRENKDKNGENKGMGKEKHKKNYKLERNEKKQLKFNLRSLCYPVVEAEDMYESAFLMVVLFKTNGGTS